MYLTLSQSPWQLNNRWLLVALVLAWLVLGSTAHAAEPPPVKGYATAKQVEVLEKRVAELEAKLGLKAGRTAACAKGNDLCGCERPTRLDPKPGPCDCSNCALTCFPIPAGEATHVSPDGTVNVRHADGIYRAVPGAPRQAPPQTSSAPTVCGPSGCYSPAAWSAPAYLPSVSTSGSSCPGGTCSGGTCRIR